MTTGGDNNKTQRSVSGPPVGPPIAPAIISRTPVFQPRFKNLKSETIEAETPWGKVRISGKIGGVHRKILDSIFACAIKTKATEEGARMLIVDLYQVAKTAGVTRARPDWILAKIRDMMAVWVEIEDYGTHLHHVAHIISEYRESPHRVPLPGGALQGDRPYYVVIISSAWMRIYDSSLIVRYRNILSEINHLSDGATHAVALHLVTHEDHTVGLDRALDHVGAWDGWTSERHRRRIREQVLREAERLQQIGINLYRQAESGEWMIAYHHVPGVHFQNPSES